MTYRTLPTAAAAAQPPLRRTLGFWLLLFYGIGIIVGAGIYVLVGTVAAKSGMTSPLAFVAAGLLAALTGLAYAELVTRLPEASGAVAYVHAAARHRATAWLVGLAVLLIAVTSGASIARGSAGYVQRFIDVPAWVPGAVFVAAFTAIACLRVELGARIAAICSAVEVIGLVIAIAAGADALGTLPARAGELVPADARAWGLLAEGAFIAFFAFIGFESLVNMAEEANDPRRTVFYSIVGAVLVSTLLYIVVAAALVFAGRGGQSPLIDLFQGPHATLFAAVGALAIANGVLDSCSGHIRGRWTDNRRGRNPDS